MKNKIKMLKCIPALFFSCFLIGLGVAMIITYDCGADPISLFQLGISNKTGYTVGTVSLLYCIMTLLLALVINRNRIGIGTLIYSLSLGYFMDYFMAILPRYTGIVCVILYFVGQVFMCFGIASMLYLNLGVSCLDAIIDQLAKLFHVGYGPIKCGFDFLFSVAGILLGSHIGWGSVYLTVSTGLMVEWILVYMKKLCHHRA